MNAHLAKPFQMEKSRRRNRPILPESVKRKRPQQEVRRVGEWRQEIPPAPPKYTDVNRKFTLNERKSL